MERRADIPVLSHNEVLKPGQQVASLETLRLVASIIIVCFHYSWYLERRDLFKGYLAVDLFFVLSGFVIAFVYRRRMSDRYCYARYLKARFARLYPLHILTLGIYGAIGVAALTGLLHVVGPGKYNMSEFLPNLLLIHAWGWSHGFSFDIASWSISAEMAAYLLFPLTLWLLDRGPVRALAIVAGLYALGIFFCLTVLNKPLPQLSWDFGVIRALPSFALGVWLCLHRPWLSSLFSPKVTVAAFYAASITFVSIVIFSLNDYVGLFAASALVVFSALADYQGKSSSVSHPRLNAWGSLTYSIYMTHLLMATIFISGVFPTLLGRSLASVVLSIGVSAVLTIVLSSLSLRYFENPAKHWILSGGEKVKRSGRAYV